ncbi:hypothetical protein [Bradyrhizobium sp.]|uniref:hypothetical protein n=1 Tax=Bradyrhizobium sp. TaxID=376 RepID=UPI003C436C0F
MLYLLATMTVSVELAMLHPATRKSFYVVVSRNGIGRDCWCWEIRRRRNPMGVRIREGGFPSHRAAELAGRDALEDFLNSLSRETGLQNTF